MKKGLFMFLLLVFTLSLAACGGGEEDREPPVIEGIEDEEVLQGSSFDAMDGVSATDHDGNDITDQVEVDGSVNTDIEGEHNLTYTVEDSEGLETTENRYITVIFETEEPYQVYNGDFSLGNEGWTLDKPGGEADWEVSDETLNVSVTDPGNEWWQLQIYQLLEIEEDQTYTVEFTARSSEGKSLGIGFEDENSGYEMIAGGAYAVELSDSMETYTYDFQSDRTTDAAKFVLYLGQMGEDEESADVEIDDISISIADHDSGDLSFDGIDDTVIMLNDDFDPMEGVTAENDGSDVTDDIEVRGMVDTNVANRTPYVIQYIIEDGEHTLIESRVVDVEIEDSEDRIFNPDFEMGVTGWTVDFPENIAEGSMEVVDDEMQVDITDGGDEYWHSQLSQSDRTIEEGKTYELSVTAKADDAKTIAMGAENADDDFALITDPLPEFELTSSYETYTVEFTADETLESVKYTLFFGQMADSDTNTTVYIDDFSVREVVSSGASVVENPDMEDDTGWDFDFPEGEDSEGSMDYVDDTIEADISDTGSEWWHIQLQQEGIEVDADVTYLMEVRVKSSEERTVGLGIEDADNDFESVIDEDLNYTVGTEYETLRYVFTPENNYENLKLALFLGNIDSDPATDVTVDSFDLTVADEQNILENSTFEDDSDWALEFNETADGTMNVEDNVLTADITDIGTEWWHIQLAQEEVSIEDGESYLVSFRASSTEARRIGLGIEDAADDYNSLKGDDPVEWDLTDTMETYTYVFDSQDDVDTAKFALFLGWHQEDDSESEINIEDFFVIQLDD